MTLPSVLWFPPTHLPRSVPPSPSGLGHSSRRSGGQERPLHAATTHPQPQRRAYPPHPTSSRPPPASIPIRPTRGARRLHCSVQRGSPPLSQPRVHYPFSTWKKKVEWRVFRNTPIPPPHLCATHRSVGLPILGHAAGGGGGADGTAVRRAGVQQRRTRDKLATTTAAGTEAISSR